MNVAIYVRLVKRLARLCACRESNKHSDGDRTKTSKHAIDAISGEQPLAKETCSLRIIVVAVAALLPARMVQGLRSSKISAGIEIDGVDLRRSCALYMIHQARCEPNSTIIGQHVEALAFGSGRDRGQRPEKNARREHAVFFRNYKAERLRLIDVLRGAFGCIPLDHIPLGVIPLEQSGELRQIVSRRAPDAKT